MNTNQTLANRLGRFTAVTTMFAMAILFLSRSAGAANTWTGGGASANWSDNNNWGGSAPGYGTLTFSGSTRTTNTMDANWSENQLIWSGSSAWTMNNGSGNVMSLFDNGGTQSKLENNSSGLVTINAPITYAENNGSPPNPFGELNAVSGDIIFPSGTLTVSGSSCNGIKMWGGSGRTVTFGSTVSASGKWFGFTAAPAGTAVIGGAFTSGDFYVMNGGTLNLNTGGAFSTTAVRLGGDFGNTGNQNQTLGGTFNLTSASGGQTFSGTINSVSGNTSGALVVYSGNVSGTNTLTGGCYLDSGLRLTNAVGGTLQLAGGADVKTQQIVFGPAGTILVSGPLTNSLAAGGTLLLNGPGALLLTNVNNTYTGTSTGSLNANGTQIANGGTLGIWGDGCLGLAPAGAYNNLQFIGFGILQDTVNNVSLNANRNISIASGVTATLDSGTNSFAIAGIINGGGSVAKIGAGTLTFSAANTYTNGTTIKAGTLVFSGGSSTSASGPLGPSNSIVLLGDVSGAANATLTHSGAAAVHYYPITIQAGGSGIKTLADVSSMSVNYKSNIVLNDSVTLDSGNSGNIILTGPVTGVGGLNKVGNGTAQLNATSSANTYTGNTTISQGLFQVGSGTAIPSGSGKGTVLLNPTSPNTATFDLNGNNQTINGLASSGTGNAVVDNVSSSAKTLTVGTSGSNPSGTFSGVMQNSSTGTLGLTKAGSGTLTLGGANTYSGSTIINGGTLALGSGGSINNSTNISIAAGATFDVSAISAYSLSGGTTLSASGTASAVTIKGGTTVSLGSQPVTLTYDGLHPALSISQGALSLNGNAFTVNSSSALAVGTYTIVQQRSRPARDSPVLIPLAAASAPVVGCAPGDGRLFPRLSRR